MAGRHLDQEVACWLKLLAKLAKQRDLFGLGTKEGWVSGKELAKQHFLLAVDELGEC